MTVNEALRILRKLKGRGFGRFLLIGAISPYTTEPPDEDRIIGELRGLEPYIEGSLQNGGAK